MDRPPRPPGPPRTLPAATPAGVSSAFDLDINSLIEHAADSAAFAAIEGLRRAPRKPVKPAGTVAVESGLDSIFEPLLKPEVEEVGWSQFAALTDVGELPEQVQTEGPRAVELAIVSLKPSTR